VLRDNAMGLRILIGIMVLGFALRMSRNIYRDMKRTESGNESRYLYGMKVNLWKEPLPKGKRVVFALVSVPLNVLLYLFAAVVLFNIDPSTVLPFLGKK
jgi:hypothetical protein